MPEISKRPNFLVFITDQMRADHLGCDGNPAIRTPRLDELATGGVRLNRAYVNCPLCMPSRATLYTGLTPRGHRVRTNGIPLDTSFPTFTQALADAGYETASVGKIHLTNYGRHENLPPDLFPPERFPELKENWDSGRIDKVPVPFFGLREVTLTIGHGRGVGGDYLNWLRLEHPEEYRKLLDSPRVPSPLCSEGCERYPVAESYHHTAFVADGAVEFIKRQDGENPFLLFCSFPDPHHPYAVPAPYDTMYSPDEVVPPVAREGELDDLAPFFRDVFDKGARLSGRFAPTNMPDENRREIIAYTYGMVSLVDKHVGRVLDALDAKGLSEDTVVLFLSDHGDMMGDHGLLNKGPFHFEGLLRIPMLWRFPKRFKPRALPALSSILDVAPTILDLAGVPIPEGLSSPETPSQPPAWPGRSLVPALSGKTDSVQESVIVENDEDYLGLRLRTLITSRWKLTTYTAARGPEPYGEMFDLEEDPHELHNRWSDPDFAGEKAKLIEALHYRLTGTDIAVPRRLSHA